MAIQATEKHEYFYGEVFAMAGASDAHVTVCLNAALLLKSHLRSSDCRTYMSDMRLCAHKDHAYFYPDVMVCCDSDDHKRSTMKHSPLLIIEVLSPSTEAYERGDKFATYRQLDSLLEYVLIDPNQLCVDIFRLNERQRWELFSFRDEADIVTFTSIHMQCTLLEFYEEVDFSTVSTLST